MKLSEYRAQRLREDNGRDLLLSSLDALDPLWSSRFDSVRDAATFYGIDGMLDAPETDQNGEPRELNFHGDEPLPWEE